MILNENKTNSDTIVEGFNLKKAISTYTKQWKWFVLSLTIALAAASIYIRYTTPEYSALAKVKLIDENEGSSAGAMFKDLSLFSDSESAKVEDEIHIFKSRKLFAKVVENLNLNIQFFLQGRIYETEIYNNVPFEINFIVEDSIINKTDFSFYVKVLSDVDFDYRIKEGNQGIKKVFGENISSDFGGMIITPALNNVENLIGKTIKVKISPVNRIAAKYRNKIKIFPTGKSKSSRIVGISLNDPVISKAKDVINEAINQYIKFSIDEKKLKSKKTADFISERIDLIATDLSEVDDSDEKFRTGNKLTNVTSEADLYLSSSSRMQQELAASRTELNVINFMKEQIEDESGFKAIPSNVGVSDPSIASSAAKYNELINNRERLLKSSNEKNPIIVSLDQELNSLKNNLRQSLNNSSKTIGIKVRGLQNQSDKINSKIYAVPGQTRKLRDIQREQGTKEALYIYLLEKREEAAISLAATSAKAIVVEEAYNNKGGPVFPDKKIIFISAIFLGLLFPFSIVYANDLLDTKIHNKEDLDGAIKNITVLGEIPKVKGGDTLVKRNDRSILSESFRIMRTNFDYIQRGRKVENYNNVIFVTSTINGEGKSFFSMNMALTLANTDKRVLLIGADIRNPKLLMGINNQKKNNEGKVGLTEYLVDKSVIVGEAINTYEVNGNKIDILLSGKVPPNPAELLMSDRMKPLFDKVSEQYDYVIVDTAPSMLVTDTLLFSQYAGHTIYMTRADYTEKRILNFAKELHAENKLNGMMLVVNDVKQANFGYGAKYGYYGAKKKKGFFSKRA